MHNQPCTVALWWLKLFSFNLHPPSSIYQKALAADVGQFSAMADPFSVAASAVSVVSLGIQVCQGLLSYCDEYRSYDDTLNSLCKEIEDLRSTLELCDGFLQKPEATKLKASVNVTKSIDACKNGFTSLQATLDSLKKTPNPQGLKAKFHNHGLHALYPFHTTRISQLQKTLNGLQGNLHIALQALQMYFSNMKLS